MNIEKYKKIFAEALSIDESKFNEKIKYNDIPEWDSIGHMTLISALEEKFSISIDTDDIVDFSSFEVGKKILAKYGIKF
jgi:acyl carrier protein